MDTREYVYLRIERDKDSDLREVEKELMDLMKFLNARSTKNKQIIYVTLSYSHKGRYAGYIIVLGEDKDLINKEAEIISSYATAHYSSITVVQDNIKSFSQFIGLPKQGFFRET